MVEHRGLAALAGRRHHCIALGASCRTLTCTLGGKTFVLEVKMEAFSFSSYIVAFRCCIHPTCPHTF